MKQKCTTQQFIEKARKVHGDFYDYSKVDYQGNKIKITIICPIHGEFQQAPHNHLNGQGCPKCYRDSLKSNKQKFVEKARKTHSNFYSYEEFIYTKSNEKSYVTCPIHGNFLISPNNHLRGRGCPKCRNSKLSNLYSFSTEEWIEKAKQVHKDLYDYSLVDYQGAHQKVSIICNRCHTVFEQEADSHLRGSGCPRCAYKESKGERFISDILDKLKIQYKKQYSCKDSKHNRTYIFDFYIDGGYVIEFNGQQHYKSIDIFGGEQRFEYQKTRDSNLRDFCQENGLKLLEIKYDMKKDIIENTIKQFYVKN